MAIYNGQMIEWWNNDY